MRIAYPVKKELPETRQIHHRISSPHTHPQFDSYFLYEIMEQNRFG